MAAPAQLKQIVEGHETLTRPEAASLMQQILAGDFTDLQLAALLGALGARGETPSELAGFVDVMRAAATPLPLTPAEQAVLVDTCGTGGDASGTFNISTAAALVAAAAGASVAKHGNRAVTSACGSADVLEAIGIPVGLTPAQAAGALRAHRFAFLHAPAHHPAMKAVMPVRRALGVRTVFNLLGPLANPAGAQAQVMGVYSAHLVPIVAQTMQLLGVRHAFVVHGATTPGEHASSDGSARGNLESARGNSGMDEVSIAGPTRIAEVRDGFVTHSWLTPERVGLASAPVETLHGGDAFENAGILRAVFSGEPGPRRDVVLLNAALVLIAAGIVPPAPRAPYAEIRAGIDIAAATIDSGAVTTLICTLATSH
jgi:anthranilate phosphoribosyltransferase